MICHRLFEPDNRRRCVEQLSRLAGYRRLGWPSKSHRQAAVLLPLCFVANQPGLLFLRRPLGLRSHPGEISFPGGRCDDLDNNDPVKTALRETHEEIGLSASDIDVWTTLPWINGSSTVIPVIGFCGHLKLPTDDKTPLKTGEKPLIINKSEVESVQFRSLDWLVDPRTVRSTRFRYHRQHLFHLPTLHYRFTTSQDYDDKSKNPLSQFQPHQLCFTLPVFDDGGERAGRIWGMTAIMVYQLMDSLLPPEDGWASRLSRPLVNKLSPLVHKQSR